ncbi:Dockerin type I repeat protein [Rubripirellula tenax]|uniref:Dockerin type I repeat protein n=1 Tax=Rubripirellula tenax TaxID=2528015 RepID=A0A5C6FBT7_9BACT|nr:Dockerin type I repeat protein [Rubripirellula tenax]
MFHSHRHSLSERKPSRNRTRARLRLESLEKRQLLAVGVIAPVGAELFSEAGSYHEYGTSGSQWYDGSGISDASVVETGDPIPTLWPEHVAGNNSTRVSRIRLASEVNVLTFDLGGTFDVSGMVLWNSTEAGQTDRGFENTVLSYSTDGGLTFTGSDSLTWTERGADGSANQGNTPTPPVALFAPEVKMLSSAVGGVTHVRMNVDNFSTAGSDNIVMASEIRFIGESAASTSGVYNEANGLVVMEMENTPSDLGLWQEQTQLSNYTGDSYFQFLGNNYQSGPANSPLEYRFRINTPGLYYLHLRSAKENSADPTRTDISNDAYVRVDGDYNAGPGPHGSHGNNASLSLLQSNTKFFGGALNSFKWDSGNQLDPGGDTNKRVAVYDFKAGEEYTLVVSGRSKFYSIDRIVFRHESTAVGTAQNLNTPESSFIPAQDTGNVAITGELKQWHKTTLTLDGPTASESGSVNPFTDYRMNVTFTHPASGLSYTVPGYFAADGDAANTGATSGNKWRAHLAADVEGSWNYSISFRTGTNVAVNDSPTAGTALAPLHGITGSFTIGATDKTGDDFRAKGRLEYVGEHYLQFAGTGDFFIKQGPDAPENLLAYADVDGDFKTDGNYNRGTFASEAESIKQWNAHEADWNAGDPTWSQVDGTQGTYGKGLIGAINYLASEDLNAFSFLTMNINGDDKNVFPYTTYSERSRIDVSKLDQWEIVFEHGDKMGMYLHFKTQETENDQLLDGGDLGNERKLYYRELIARFSHHLGMNWNLGEETTNTTQQLKDFAQYFHDNDPYRHNVVLHTYPGQKDQRYTPLLGSASELTGLSLQTSQADFSNVHVDTATWVANSAAAGKKWVVAVDEPGDAQHALRPDNDAGNSHVDGRKNALWGTLMAGGAGNEWYFGYGHAESDLTLEDFRSRDNWWDYTRYAKSFFEDFDIPFWEMIGDDSISTASNDYGFYKEGEVYTVYLKNGGTTSLNLGTSPANEVFNVKWFDPRNGGGLLDGTVTQVNGGGTVSLGQPPNSVGEDWAILVTSEFFVPGLAVDGAFLVNADNDSDIAALTDGMVINLATMDTTNLNIRATTEGAAGSVGFALTGATTRNQSETVAPYALFGDDSGNYRPGTLNVGQHTLVVTPFSEASLNGTAGQPITIHFVVSDGNTNSPPTGSVTITGTLTEGQTLTASNTLADGDGIGPIRYQWQRDGVNVSGATGNTYALNTADVGTKISVVASYTDGSGKLEQVSSALDQPATYSFAARTNFPVIDAGEVVYYADNPNDALAINAAVVADRDKFARASHTFTGQSGVYPLRITTLTEEDGESIYRLLVNGSVVGTYQNPRIGSGSPLDLQPNQHVWNDIALQSGDIVSVESNTDTNGEIPEGTGTAWARGRWRSLDLFTGVGPVVADNSGPTINKVFLVDSDSDADIVELTNGAVISLTELARTTLNARATTNLAVGSVRFALSGATTKNQTESVAPYALFGDTAGDFAAGTLALGQHTLVVTPYSGGGLTGTVGTPVTIVFEVTDAVTSVVGRSVAYRGAGATYGEGLADPNKSALHGPGATASMANYTNYSQGLNRVIVDIDNLPATTLTQPDFEFRVGNTEDFGNNLAWTSMPSSAIDVATLTGATKRVTIDWPHQAIMNRWLEVTVKANANTGLDQDDVFYFGNQVGDVDGSISPSKHVTVNAFDTLDVRFHQSPSSNSVGIDNIYDIDRNGSVNAFDTLDVRFNQMPSGGLMMITLPPAAAPTTAASIASAAIQNPDNALDVNGDGQVTALDALMGINFLGQTIPSSELTGFAGRPSPAHFYDVNGDGRVTALDSLQIINKLGSASSGQAEQASIPQLELTSDDDDDLDWVSGDTVALEAAIDSALNDL